MVKIELKEGEGEILVKKAFEHPHPHIQKKLLVVHMRSQGFGNKEICKALGIKSQTTIVSYCHEYGEGGIELLCTLRFNKPKSKLHPYETELKQYFQENPPRSVAEAIEVIAVRTGIRRKRSFVQKYLHQIGMKFLKAGGVPAKADPKAQEDFKKNSWILG